MTRAHRNEIAYPALWRAIDGAIRDAAANHDDILIPDKRRSSVVKRAVGRVLALKGAGVAPATGTAVALALPGTAIGAQAASVEGAAQRGGRPHIKLRGKRNGASFPWPAGGFDCAGRRQLRVFLRGSKFTGLHRGRDGLIFVRVTR